MRAVAAGLALLLTLASCAPTLRPHEAVDLSTVTQRYERLRALREAAVVAARMEATAWIEADAFGHLPTVQLDVALAGPDGIRARLASLFGTALDLQVRGDSLSAYVPARRLGLEVGSLEDSLGVRLPGAWACRAIAANWSPREARWSMANGDTLWRSAWIEGSDSLAMSVDASGLPAALDLRSAAGRTLHVTYPGWNWNGATPWPARVVVEDPSSGFRAELRLDRVRFQPKPDPRWMAMTIPASAEILDWTDLRDALARLGSRP